MADAVAAARADGDVAVLLGGDCTLVLGAVAGLRRQEEASGEVGCSTSTATPTWTRRRRGGGCWTVAVSPTCSATATPSWPPCGPDRPLLDPGAPVLFGFHPAQLSTGQWGRFASHGLYGVPVTGMPPGTAGRRAAQALARLQGKCALLCHLDVDVIDYAQFPLADCPRYHGGLSLPDAFDAVAAAAGHPGLACLTLTEVNPGHDPAGELTQGAGDPLGSRDRGRPDALTSLVPQRATFARFDACAIERAVGDGQASAVQGQTLAQVGHASRGDGASQARWG